MKEKENVDYVKEYINSKNAQNLYHNYLKGNLPPNAKINPSHSLRTGETGIKITVGDEMGIYTDMGKIVSYHPLKITKQL